MKYLFFVPLALASLSSCSISQAYRAMENNRCAIQRSTYAIEQNVEALDKVTDKLEKMQGAS